MRSIASARSSSPLATRILFSITLFGISPPAAAEPLSYYLPAGVEHAEEVPAPAEVFGFEVGEQHVRPDQLVAYFEALAASSPRVRVEVQGRTHESRPLLLATIGSEENLARLEELRRAHLAAGEPEAELSEEERAELPVVVWLGYSVHGDEASGSNAAPLVAYHLAAGRGEAVERLLEKTIVLIDPSLNPDGLARFAQWATMHRGEVPVASRDHREHRQGWPSGRTNHYWFDLNRDWMPAVHPESRARLETYQRWRPHLMGDYHEMGSDSTYFFQPGVATRVNPWIPAANQELTARIARHHAAALDDAAVLYYSGETFDDFYPGKGSTYPDLAGSIGILFEQASARGRLIEGDRGTIGFPSTIRNQLLTSLSMLEGAVAEREALIAYRRGFARRALEAAEADDTAFHLVAFPGDPARAAAFLELLGRHRIEVRPLRQAVEAGGERFSPGEAWAIPTRQSAYRLVQALFDARRDFADSTFYDVSAWTLPLAFDARWAPVERREAERLGLAARLGEPIDAPPEVVGGFERSAGAVAYAFSWRGERAPAALARLLDAGVEAFVATRGLGLVSEALGRDDSGDEAERLPPGAVIVPLPARPDARQPIENELERVAGEEGVEIMALRGGLIAGGEDLGSPAMRPLAAPRPLLVVGRGARAYDAGEIWHLLDHRVGLPVALVEADRLGSADLSRFTHVLLADGELELEARARRKLGHWLRDGGVVVASGRAARSEAVRRLAGRAGDEAEEEAGGASGAEPAAPEPSAEPPEHPGAARVERAEGQRYADYERARQAAVISGAVLEARLDSTHPLGFGFDDETLPLFHRGAEPLADTGNAWETVAVFADEPLLAGYAPEAALAALAGTPALTAQRVGEGTLVRLAGGPAFRGFWVGSHKLLLNALFFGGAIDRTPEELDRGR